MRGLMTDVAFVALGFAVSTASVWTLLPVALYSSGPQPADFDHAAHGAGGAELECDHCHSFAKDGRFEGIPEVGTCLECHDPANPVAPAGVAWRSYSRQPDNAWFPHASHVLLARLECKECHGDHAATSTLPPVETNRITGYSRAIWGTDPSGISTARPDSMKMSDCEECHENTGATDTCQDCHR